MNPNSRQSTGSASATGLVGVADLGDQEARAPDRQQQAGDGARHGEEQALGQELPDQPAVRRAEGQTRRQLVAPRRGARQQQVGDVGAGDEQHQRRRSRPAPAAARGSAGAARTGRSRPAPAGAARRGSAAPASRPASRAASPRGSAAARRAAPLSTASIDWSGWRRSMMLSHHVDRPSSALCRPPGRTRSIVPIGAATSNVRPTVGPRKRAGTTPTIVNGTPLTASERPTTPGSRWKRRSQKRSLMTSVGPSGPPPRRSSSGRQQAAERRADAERLEEAAAHHQRFDRIGLAAVREVESFVGPGERAGDAPGHPIPQRFPDRVGQAAAVEDDQLAGTLDRQRPQQQRVDEREDGGVGADAESHRQQRRDHAGPGSCAG